MGFELDREMMLVIAGVILILYALTRGVNYVIEQILQIYLAVTIYDYIKEKLREIKEKRKGEY